MDFDRGLPVDLLSAAFLAKISVRWFPLASRVLSLECLGTLIIVTATGKTMTSNTFWTYKSFLFSFEVRTPCCFHNIPKS